MKANLLINPKPSFIPVNIVIETEEELNVLMQLLYASIEAPVSSYLPTYTERNKFTSTKRDMYLLLDAVRQSK